MVSEIWTSFEINQFRQSFFYKNNVYSLFFLPNLLFSFMQIIDEKTTQYPYCYYFCWGKNRRWVEQFQESNSWNLQVNIHCLYNKRYKFIWNKFLFYVRIWFIHLGIFCSKYFLIGMPDLRNMSMSLLPLSSYPVYHSTFQ